MAYKYFSPNPPVRFVPDSTEEQSKNPFAANYKKPIRDNYYPPEFLKIKPKIIKKFNDRCFLCNDIGVEVHHIDYDKMNCSENNFVLLCKSCHSKTNTNREYWQNLINKKLKNFTNMEEGEDGI